MKVELKNKLKEIKEWLIKERFFLILLTFMFVSLIVSMFTEYALVACMIVAVVCAILFNFEKCLCLFLFSFSFEAVFHIMKDGKDIFTFTYFYSIIFAICLVKYLIKVFKKERKINIKIIIPMALFLIYILLPIKPIKLNDIVKYIVAFSFLYLILEYKNEINFSNLLIIASISLIISICSTLIAQYSDRMNVLISVHRNYGVIKVQGIFTNPNWLMQYILMIIAWLLCKFIFDNYLWGMPLLVLLPYSYKILSRDYILSIILLFFSLLIILLIKRKKVYFLKGFLSIILMIGIAFAQWGATKIYIRRIGTVFDEACVFLGIENKINIPAQKPDEEILDKPDNPPNENKDYLWIDGTPIDPGRAGLWKRYLKDFKSSPRKMILGAGVSADVLGMGAHNVYIQVLWRFGIVGSLLSIFIFWLIFKEIIKSKNLQSIPILLLVCFINLCEGNFFNYIAIMMMIVLISMCQTKENQIENKSEQSEDK